MASSPKPGKFVACGHPCPPGAVPSSENEHVVISMDNSMYEQPALCMECQIKHTKNRQQLVVDTYRSGLMAAENDIIERFLKIENTRVRNELMLTSKRIATEDINLQRDAEIVSLWLTFSETWNFAVRARTIEVPCQDAYYLSLRGGNVGHPRGAHHSVPRTVTQKTTKEVNDYLTILVDRGAGQINVTGTWKAKEDNSVVETVDITKC